MPQYGKQDLVEVEMNYDRGGFVERSTGKAVDIEPISGRNGIYVLRPERTIRTLSGWGRGPAEKHAPGDATHYTIQFQRGKKEVVIQYFSSDCLSERVSEAEGLLMEAFLGNDGRYRNKRA